MRLRRSLLAAALAATACTDGTPSPARETTPPPAPSNAVRIEGIDYGYTISGTVQAGLTRITFANTGKDIHMAVMARLRDGKRPADVLAALQTSGDADDKATFVDMEATLDTEPGIVTPGATTTAYATLETGTYALVCFYRTPEGKFHYDAGMLNGLTVTDGPATMPEPAVAGEVVTDDKMLTVPDFSSGKGTYRYTNNGKDLHALMFVRLHDGRTYEDFVRWADSFFVGAKRLDERPGDIWGGVGETKRRTFFELDLPPGRYVALDTEKPVETGGGGEYFRGPAGLRAEFTVT